MTRGERNNNPLNIRRARGTRWKGQAAEQHDREYVQFESLLMGFRAAFRILRTYIMLYHLNTIRGIVNRWAPPEDGNLTTQYIHIVCMETDMTPGDVIDFNNRDQMIRLCAAMARVECGMRKPDMEMVAEAYEMAKAVKMPVYNGE